MAGFTHVTGKEKGKIILYALSTCVWCKKTRKLLDDLGLGYDYVEVDLLDNEESDRLDEEVRKWNPKGTYPTIVIDGQRAICGYQEQEVKGLAK